MKMNEMDWDTAVDSREMEQRISDFKRDRAQQMGYELPTTKMSGGLSTKMAAWDWTSEERELFDIKRNDFLPSVSEFLFLSINVVITNC